MKTKTDKAEKLDALGRQLLRNKNTKLFEVHWQIVKGQIPDGHIDPNNHAFVRKTSGITVMAAEDSDSAISRFQSAYHVVSRFFKITDCKEVESMPVKQPKKLS